MANGSRFEVTVYIGLGCIAYLSPSLLKCDGQDARKLPNSDKADPPIHHAEAFGTNRLEVPDFVGDWQAIRHRSGRWAWQVTSEAKEFPELAGLLFPCSTTLEEVGELDAQDENWSPFVAGR